MPELTRDALFEALRRRRHYGTTGTRLFLDLRGTFDRPVTGFSDDPQLAPADEAAVREALMGDIIRPGAVPMRLAAEVIGTAPIERVDVLHGTHVVQTVRPIRRRRPRPPRARALAGRGVSRPRPRDHVAGKADAHGQSHCAVSRR